MENSQRRVVEIMFLLGLLFLLLKFSPAIANEQEPAVSLKMDEEQSSLQTYIVFTKKPEAAGPNSLQYEDLNAWYKSFLPTATSSNHQPQMVHTYRNVVMGFAARLTPDQVKAMEGKEGFLSAQPERMLSLQTTHTPNFLGLMNQGLNFWKKESNYGKGVIIGVVDTGIWHDHPSFGDEGVPPPPAKWKGKCELNGTVCNNKLIGARNCIHGDANTLSPYEVGHGTHTSSTAAGNFVKDANAYGFAKGTAVGMAPHAHLAIYKVCSKEGCKNSDMLAGLDAAVEDGVDVISMSIVYYHNDYIPFYDDAIALGAFGATQKGILVSCSAGNIGPEHKTLSNEAPWILTVGASTIDRTIKATARLGNGAEFDGESLFQPKDFHPVLLPLVYPGSNGNRSTAFCKDGSLKSMDVKGKIVVCETSGWVSRTGYEVRRAGGAAMIVINKKQDGYTTLAEHHVLPATHLDYASGLKIKAYINSTHNPKATILFRGTVIGESSSSVAPAVPFFSSRGPSKASPGILKPDIIGPGVSILAAYPFPTDNNTARKKTSMFNILSGTSMSCPHLSGIAALLKSSHPHWSPATIKSAIMTTADVVNHGGKPIVDERFSPADVFAIGAGHVNPSKANDPGLIYDIQPDDYIPYLCGLNYTDNQVEIITQRTVIKCSKVESIAETQLNYPSFSVVLGSESLSFTRTVINVGEVKSTYTLEMFVPPGIGIIVRPEKIVFSEVNQKATYTVEFIPQSHKQFGGEGFPQSHTGKDGKRYAEG